ncbi:MAG: hypothetical protein ABW223_02020 [Rariglobus sp.]
MAEPTNHLGDSRLSLGKGSRWDANSDFGKPILLALGFIAAVVVVLWPWMHFEMKHQRQSYEAAVSVLEGKVLREQPTQRQALLIKKDETYHWRMLVWEQDGAGFKPSVFSATVDKAQNYRVIESALVAYNPDQPDGLYPPPR